MLFARLVLSLRVGVIDAGSTGTRLKLFEFDRDAVVSQTQFRSEDMPGNKSKGLHQSSSSGVRNTIKQLLAQSNVQKSTVLGFYGTAGLRSMSPAEQSSVLDAVRAAAKDYNLIECKVITGNEEALYSLKGFEHLNPSEQSFSIIDMGGKSVQIIQRDGEEIVLSSLKMGILNSRCEESKKSSGGLFGSFGRILGLSQGLELSESAKPKEAGDASYVCRESHGAGGVWSFDCSLHNDAGALGDILLVPGVAAEKKASSLDLQMHVAEHLTARRRLDRSPLDSPQSMEELGISRSRDFRCIDEFLESKPVERLKPTSRIYLMSFFEEIVGESGVATLESMLEDFKKRCPVRLGDDCLKLYYSIQFLRKIGVGSQSDMRLVNSVQGVDISWSLGKALELRNRALNNSPQTGEL